MALYEHVLIARQDLSNAQAEGLMEQFSKVLTDNGGTIAASEYWGLRPMAYKINKNRKGHYLFVRSDAPSAAVMEMERQVRLHEDVMRCLTVRVEAHEEGQSVVMQNKGARDDRRGGRGGRGGERGGDRGGRGPREDRGPREPREDRGPREERAPRAETQE